MAGKAKRGDSVPDTDKSLKQHQTAYAWTVKIVVIISLDYSRSTPLLTNTVDH